MSDNVSKSSIALDEEIKRLTVANETLPPHVISFMIIAGGPNFEAWVNKALKEAQEDKDRFLGRLPAKAEKQPNPAISNFERNWATSHMNNKRELGPGDVKK